MSNKFSDFVIPAKAGIHLDPACRRNGNVKMDPGLRRDDEQRKIASTWLCRDDEQQMNRVNLVVRG
jgi:hypothetical protein